MSAVHAAALAAHDAGLAVLRVKSDGSKAVMGKWKLFQTERADRATVDRWFAGGHAGLGVVCGAVSGGLEMLEFEGRAVAAGMVQEFAERMDDRGAGDLWDRLTGDEGYVEGTPSGGLHLLYRCGAIGRNTKLAARPATPEELVEDPKDKVKVLIETRGEGGFVVVAPSNGTTHPTGGAWELIAGGFHTIPTITPEERRVLWEVARSFDRSAELRTSTQSTTTAPRVDSAELRNPPGLVELGTGDRPGDRYDREHSCADVLLAAGFTHHHDDDNGDQHFTRPGKDKRDGSSAAVWANNGRCTLFSTSIDAPDKFIGEGNLTPFALYAALHHGGDFSAAAKAVRVPTTVGSPPPGVDPVTGEVSPTGDTSTGTTVPSGTVPDRPPTLPDEFWNARQGLAQVREMARSRLVAPDALFGALLARVAALTPHTVKLPGIVGAGGIGLTTFVALVGPPAAGKSAAIGLARSQLPATDAVREAPAGTGEGLVELLFDMVNEVDPDTGKQVKVKRQVRHGLIVEVGEGSQLFTVAGRQGATTFSILRDAYTDAVLGNANAAADRRRILPAGNYVYGLSIGLQPRLAGPLLDEVDAGTPQRFLWFSAVDPDAPDEVPEWPGDLEWCPLGPGDLDAYRRMEGGFVRHLVTLPDAVVAATRRHRQQVNSGAVIVDEFDAHRELVTHKVAALLAILDHRLEVTEDDHALAQIVYGVSAQVRDRCRSAVSAIGAEREQLHRQNLAGRDAAVEGAQAARALDKAARAVGRKVARYGPLKRRDAVSAIASRDKAFVTPDDVLDHAATLGLIVDNGDGTWSAGTRSA